MVGIFEQQFIYVYTIYKENSQADNIWKMFNANCLMTSMGLKNLGSFMKYNIQDWSLQMLWYTYLIILYQHWLEDEHPAIIIEPFCPTSWYSSTIYFY